MDRVNGANTVDIGGGKRGWRKQNKAAGISGTEFTTNFMNGIQEEIVHVIEQAGLTPNEVDWTQLYLAILAIVADAQQGTGVYNARTFAGTANALTADCEPPAPAVLNAGDLVFGTIATTNTATGVTMTLDGGTAYTVKLADGATAPPIGSLVAGHLVLFRIATTARALFDFTAGAVVGASNGFVLKAGDTMTGPLVLPADPTAALQAATKQYVDGCIRLIKATPSGTPGAALELSLGTHRGMWMFSCALSAGDASAYIDISADNGATWYTLWGPGWAHTIGGIAATAGGTNYLYIKSDGEWGDSVYGAPAATGFVRIRARPGAGVSVVYLTAWRVDQ